MSAGPGRGLGSPANHRQPIGVPTAQQQGDGHQDGECAGELRYGTAAFAALVDLAQREGGETDADDGDGKADPADQAQDKGRCGPGVDGIGGHAARDWGVEDHGWLLRLVRAGARRLSGDDKRLARGPGRILDGFLEPGVLR